MSPRQGSALPSRRRPRGWTPVRASRPHPPRARRHRERAEDGEGPAIDRTRRRDGRGLQGAGRAAAHRPRQRRGRLEARPATCSRATTASRCTRRASHGRSTERSRLRSCRGSACMTCGTRTPRLALAGRHQPQGGLRAPRPRHRLDHARHLLARHPGDAGGGGGADRGAGDWRSRARSPSLAGESRKAEPALSGSPLGTFFTLEDYVSLGHPALAGHAEAAVLDCPPQSLPMPRSLVGRMSAVLPIRKFRARTRTTGNRQMQGNRWRRRPESNR